MKQESRITSVVKKLLQTWEGEEGFGHCVFLFSGVGATSGLLSRLGESCGEINSSSSVMIPFGLERPERAVASASSFRSASSSFSNLPCRELEYTIQFELKHSLAAENLNIETSAIPNAHREDRHQEHVAPKRTVIEDVHRGKLCQDGVKKLPAHKYDFPISRRKSGYS